MIKDNLLNKIFMSIVLISGGALSAVGMMAIMVCLVNPQMLRYDFIMPLTYTCFPLFTLISGLSHQNMFTIMGLHKGIVNFL
jgi:hypothetical protein